MIRLARAADLPDVFEIYMHPEVIPFLGHDAMPASAFREIYDRLLDSESFFVWEEHRRIKGFCRVVRHAGRSRHAAYLGTFAVHPDARGGGVAKQMLDRIILDLNRTGVSRLELTVLEDNPRAIAFYRKYGFEIEGRIRASFKRSDQMQYIDEWQMAMLFSPLDSIQEGRSSVR